MKSSLFYAFLDSWGVDPTQNLAKIQKAVMCAHITNQQKYCDWVFLITHSQYEHEETKDMQDHKTVMKLDKVLCCMILFSLFFGFDRAQNTIAVYY